MNTGKKNVAETKLEDDVISEKKKEEELFRLESDTWGWGLSSKGCPKKDNETRATRDVNNGKEFIKFGPTRAPI